MTFQFAPAVRDRVSLIVGIFGVSGSGKTRSALSLARGLANGDDTKIAFIDTEAGRARHYALAPGEKPSESRFAFQYAELRPPFSPARYTEAVAAADAAGFEVILIDSASHIWEGPGGCHDMHDDIVDREVEKARRSHSGNWEFDEERTRDRLSLGAWKTPKAEHKRFISHLLQTRAHLILCFRADEKVRVEKVKDDRGREKTVITAAKDLHPSERYSPICERRLPYELTLSLVLSPDRPGVPIPIKLQTQHEAAFPLDRPITEASGRALAEWARGGSAPPADGQVDAELAETADMRAEAGTAAYAAFWSDLSNPERTALLPAHEARKARAAQVDAERAGEIPL